MKISKNIEDLNNTNNLTWLIFTEHSVQKTGEYTFFLSAHGTFTKIDHILGHKTSLSKFKRNQAIKSVSCHQNRIKLKISYKKISGKTPNIWKLNNPLLSNPRIKEEIEKTLESILNWMKMKIQHIKICASLLKQYLSNIWWEIYSTKWLC